MLVRDIKELLEGYDDDREFGWNIYWKIDTNNPDAEPCFGIDMIRDMELAIFPLDDDEE